MDNRVFNAAGEVVQSGRAKRRSQARHSRHNGHSPCSSWSDVRHQSRTASRGDYSTKPITTLETAEFQEAEAARSAQLEEQSRKRQIAKTNRATARQASELRDQECPPATLHPLHRAEADAAMALAETRMGVSTAEQVSDIRTSSEIAHVGTFSYATLEMAWYQLCRNGQTARTAVKTKMLSGSKKGALCFDESAETRALYATHQRRASSLVAATGDAETCATTCIEMPVLTSFARTANPSIWLRLNGGKSRSAIIFVATIRPIPKESGTRSIASDCLAIDSVAPSASA